MTNRIASLLSDDPITAPPPTPELDWKILFDWIAVLDRASSEEGVDENVDVDALRDAFRRSGVLIWDGPEWVIAEGGLRQAVTNAYHRDLSYVRNTMSALYYADDSDPAYFPVAIESGVMYCLVIRAHNLVKTFDVIRELIEGE
ncbi:MAG: hypothetical protein H0W15_05130 [Gemmatimonadales bacterium]|nr:hypothetical protein [Gemmatimonadales bacterium]